MPKLPLAKESQGTASSHARGSQGTASSHALGSQDTSGLERFDSAQERTEIVYSSDYNVETSTGIAARIFPKTMGKAGEYLSKKKRASVKQEEQAKMKIGHENRLRLIQRPTVVRRGRLVRKFQGSREYVVSIKFRLDEMPLYRSNIFHMQMAEDENTVLPSIDVKPGRMNVYIKSGNRFPDDTRPIVSVEVMGNPATRWNTAAAANPWGPVWDHTHYGMEHLEDDDELEFTVWDAEVGQGTHLGRTWLSRRKLYPHGFEGTLELAASGAQAEQVTADDAIIYVAVEIETACRVSVMLRQGNRELEVPGPEGLPLFQDVDVEFSLNLAPHELDGDDISDYDPEPGVAPLPVRTASGKLHVRSSQIHDPIAIPTTRKSGDSGTSSKKLSQTSEKPEEATGLSTVGADKKAVAKNPLGATSMGNLVGAIQSVGGRAGTERVKFKRKTDKGVLDNRHKSQRHSILSNVEEETPPAQAPHGGSASSISKPSVKSRGSAQSDTLASNPSGPILALSFRDDVDVDRVQNLERDDEVDYLANIQIGTVVEQKAIRISFSKSVMWAFMGNPREEAPRALVKWAVFKWVAFDNSRQIEHDREAVFQLPPLEAEELRKMRWLTQQNSRWRNFDAFFGTWIIIAALVAGIQIGLETQHPDIVEDSTWVNIERFFFAIFLIEFLLRIYIIGKKWHRQFDAWLFFDFLVLLVNGIDIFTDSLPFTTSVLRLIRLAKLAKMVRLVRAYKALGAIVQAAMNSWAVLFWTEGLLFVVIYCGSIWVVSLTVWVLEDEEQDIPDYVKHKVKPFRKVTSAMWEFLVMVTFDGWADYVRAYSEGIGGWKGFVIAASIMAVMLFAAVGICNMIIGLMCHTAFILGERNVRMENAEKLETKRLKLSEFRDALKSYGARPIFKSDIFINKTEIAEILWDYSHPKRKADISKSAPHYETLIRAHEADEKMRSCLDVLELKSEDLLRLSAIFADENGDCEISGLIEACSIIQLQRYYGELNAMDRMTFGKVGLAVRPIDILFFQTYIGRLEEAMRFTERNVMGLCAASLDIMHVLERKAQDSGLPFEFDSSEYDVARKRLQIKKKEERKHLPTRSMGVIPLVRHVTNYKKVTMLQLLSLPMDIFFGFFILLNGIFMGFQSTYDRKELENTFYVIDIVFTSIFAFEIYNRALLHVATKEDMFEEVDWKGSRIYVDDAVEEREHQRFAGSMHTGEMYDIHKIRAYRKRLRFFIFPPCPKGGYRAVIRGFPEFLCHASTFFDFIIVFLLAGDLLIFEGLRRFNLVTLDATAVSVMRIFRLTRLGKLLRILKLFKALQQVLFVMVSTGRLIFFTVMIICVVIYMASIVFLLCNRAHDADVAGKSDVFMAEIRDFLSGGSSNTTAVYDSTDTTGRSLMSLREFNVSVDNLANRSGETNPNFLSEFYDKLTGAVLDIAAEEEEFKMFFGTLIQASLTGWQIVSLDQWPEIWQNVSAVMSWMCVLVAIMMVVGMILTNMAVGVMCAASIGLVRQSREQKGHEETIAFIRAMGELQNFFMNEVGTKMITKEVLEIALRLDMRQAKARLDKRHDGKVIKDVRKVRTEVLQDNSPAIRKFRWFIRRAGLVPVMVKHVFEALDYEQQGFIPIADFIEGCMVLREDLAKLDMFAIATGLRKLRNKSVEADQRLAWCHFRLESLLQNMVLVIQRADYDDKMHARKFHAEEHEHLELVGPAARKALDIVIKTKAGAPPVVKALGTWSCKRGHGQVMEAMQSEADMYGHCILVLQGQGTVFTHEVASGDICLVEQLTKKQRQKLEADELDAPQKFRDETASPEVRTIAMSVFAVVHDGLLKCRAEEGSILAKDGWNRYWIVKKQREDELFKKEDFQAESVQHIQVPHLHAHPAHGQNIFEWDLASRVVASAESSNIETTYSQAVAKIKAMGIKTHEKSTSTLVDFTLGHTPNALRDVVHDTAYSEYMSLLKEYRESLEMLCVISDRSVIHKSWQAWWWLWFKSPNTKSLQGKSANHIKKRFGKLLHFQDMPDPQFSPRAREDPRQVVPADSTTQRSAAAGSGTLAPQPAPPNPLRAETPALLSEPASKMTPQPDPASTGIAAVAPVAAPSAADVPQVPVKWRQQPMAKARTGRSQGARAGRAGGDDALATINEVSLANYSGSSRDEDHEDAELSVRQFLSDLPPAMPPATAPPETSV